MQCQELLVLRSGPLPLATIHGMPVNADSILVISWDTRMHALVDNRGTKGSPQVILSAATWKALLGQLASSRVFGLHVSQVCDCDSVVDETSLLYELGMGQSS